MHIQSHLWWCNRIFHRDIYNFIFLKSSVEIFFISSIPLLERIIINIRSNFCLEQVCFIENKNQIRFWDWQPLKNKNIEPHHNFTGSCKETSLFPRPKFFRYFEALPPSLLTIMTPFILLMVTFHTKYMAFHAKTILCSWYIPVLLVCYIWNSYGRKDCFSMKWVEKFVLHGKISAFTGLSCMLI